MREFGSGLADKAAIVSASAQGFDIAARFGIPGTMSTGTGETC